MGMTLADELKSIADETPRGAVRHALGLLSQEEYDAWHKALEAGTVQHKKLAELLSKYSGVPGIRASLVSDYKRRHTE